MSVVALTGVLLAGTFLVSTSSAAAHAKLSPRAFCPGGELSPHHDPFGGQISVFVSYSSANNGTNCAWAQKNVRRNQEEFLNVVIDRCATGNPASPCNPTARDQDPPPPGRGWKFFSGEVQLTNTNGKCIMVHVVYRSSSARFGPYHCR